MRAGERKIHSTVGKGTVEAKTKAEVGNLQGACPLEGEGGAFPGGR